MPADPFFKFDAHVHVGYWKTADFGGHGSGLREVAGVLSGAGITGALVMPTDSGDNIGTLASVEEFAGTPAFYFAAWIDPLDQSLPRFLESRGDRISALKFHPSFSRLPLTDKSFKPFLLHASNHNLPCIVHCGRWQEVAGWPIALSVAEAYPTIKFLLAHMGGDSPALVAGATAAIRDRSLANVYLGTESIREYWVVARALDVLGCDRLVFGSDHNLNHPGSFLAVIDALGLTKDERNSILGDNARRILAPEAGLNA